MMENRVRFGIMGAAGIARAAVVPAIIGSRNATVAALATRNPSAVVQYAQQAGIAKVYGSYEDLLSDPDIEAVYIPLPNSDHARWSIAAARAGKAVLCEKPLAVNATDAEAVVRACTDHGVLLLEGFMYRFHPQHARVRAIIDSGSIGQIVEVHAHLSVDLMNPADPSNVRFDKQLGGGALLDMGCYVVHIARSVFAEEPLEVVARWSVHEEYGVDISASAILTFAAGKTALVSCSFQGNGQGFYRVVGRRGQIDVPRGIIPGLGERVSETLLLVIDENGHRREEVLPAVDQYRLMIEAFSDTVRGVRSVIPPVNDSISNMRVLDAVARSARSGLVAQV
jgi:xylose dehydrogenase (NAD/NADP)